MTTIVNTTTTANITTNFTVRPPPPSSTGGVPVGVIVGVILLVIIILVVTCVIIRQRRKRPASRRMAPEDGRLARRRTFVNRLQRQIVGKLRLSRAPVVAPTTEPQPPDTTPRDGQPARATTNPPPGIPAGTHDVTRASPGSPQDPAQGYPTGYNYAYDHFDGPSGPGPNGTHQYVNEGPLRREHPAPPEDPPWDPNGLDQTVKPTPGVRANVHGYVNDGVKVLQDGHYINMNMTPDNIYKNEHVTGDSPAYVLKEEIPHI